MLGNWLKYHAKPLYNEEFHVASTQHMTVQHCITLCRQYSYTKRSFHDSFGPLRGSLSIEGVLASDLLEEALWPNPVLGADMADFLDHGVGPEPTCPDGSAAVFMGPRGRASDGGFGTDPFEGLDRAGGIDAGGGMDCAGGIC